MRAEPSQLVEIHEFLHPRVEEIANILPAAFGRWLLATNWARRLVERAAAPSSMPQWPVAATL